MGSLEASTLDILWKSEHALTVREVASRLNKERPEPLAYTTVLTVLSRMARKGVVVRQRAGRAFSYTPAAPNQAAIDVQRLLAKHGDSAIASFLEHAELDKDLAARLRRIVEGDSG